MGQLQAPPVKEAAKAAKEVARPGKRKGPLPLWLAEIFVIAGISGLLYAVIRWCGRLTYMSRRTCGRAWERLPVVIVLVMLQE